MPERSSKWLRIAGVILLILLVWIVAALLIVRPSPRLFWRLRMFDRRLSDLVWSSGLLVLMGGMLLPRARRTALALLILAVVLGAGYFGLRTRTAQDLLPPLLYALLDRAQVLATPFALSAGLLAATRFPPRLELLRLGTLGALAMLFVVHVLSFTLGATSPWFDIAWTALAVAALGQLGFSAWCLAFHLPEAEPPEDTARVVELVCPRCGAPQRLPARGGTCADCRLRISITLGESQCPGCGYNLRNIEADRCPECGRAVGGRS